MSSPSNVTVPALAGVSPEIERSVVDLPAPFEPISVTTSPSSTVSETPLSASIAPYRARMSDTSSSGTS